LSSRPKGERKAPGGEEKCILAPILKGERPTPRGKGGKLTQLIREAGNAEQRVASPMKQTSRGGERKERISGGKKVNLYERKKKLKWQGGGRKRPGHSLRIQPNERRGSTILTLTKRERGELAGVEKSEEESFADLREGEERRVPDGKGKKARGRCFGLDKKTTFHNFIEHIRRRVRRKISPFGERGDIPSI